MPKCPECGQRFERSDGGKVCISCEIQDDIGLPGNYLERGAVEDVPKKKKERKTSDADIFGTSRDITIFS